jgi:TolA-binding protein
MSRRFARWGAVAALTVAVAILGTALRAAEAPQAVDDYNFAAWLYNTGKYGLAVEAYQKFIKAYPKHEKSADAHFGLAQSLFHLDRFDDAAGEYEWVRAEAKEFPQRPEALFQFAQCRIASGAFEPAADLLEALRKEYPKHYLADWALARRGACLVSLSRYKEAAEQLDAFLAVYAPGDKEPDKVPATREMFKRMDEAGIKDTDAFLGLVERSLFYRALSAFNLEDFADARKRFEAFLASYPKSATADEVRFRIAQSLYRTGDFAGAAAMYAEAAKGSGEFAESAGFERGLALHKAGKLKEAAAAFAETAERFPKGARAEKARLYAGTFLYDAGDYAAAAERLRALRDAGGETAAEAAYWLGMSLLKSGKAPEAEQALDEAIKRFGDASPLKGDMLLALADARLAQNRLPEAAATFAQYAREFPKADPAPQALYSACVALHKAEAYADADARCAELLERFGKSPQAADALFLSGENRFLLKQYPASAERYGEFLKRGDAAPERKARAAFRLAWVERYAGRFDAAIDWLGKVDRTAAGESVGAECDYLLGVCQFESGKNDEAARAFEAYLGSKDSARFADDALLKMSVALSRDGKRKEAARHLERFVKDFAGSELLPQARYQLAECQYDLKDYAAAAATYRAVADDPAAGELKPFALFGLALCAYDQSAWEQAAAGFDAVAAGFPDSTLTPQALYRKGTALVKLSRWADAEQALSALLAKAPKHELARSACLVLGTSLQEQKKWPEAVAAFRRVLGDYPAGADDARCRYELAWSLREGGQTAESLDAFRQLATSHPDDPLAADAYFYLAEEKYRDPQAPEGGGQGEAPEQKTSRIDEARALYEKVLGIAADNRLADKALYRIGWCAWQTGKYAEAAATFDSLTERFPQSPLRPDAVFQAGQSYARAGQPAKAAERLELMAGDAAFRDFQYRPDALVALAESQLVLSRPEDAIKTLAPFADTYAEHAAAPQAFFILGKAHFDLRQYKDALAAFERVPALTRSETAAQAQFYVGQVHQAQEDFSAALVAYLRVQALYPTHREWVAAALFEGGKCQDALGQKDEARKAFQEVVGSYKDTRWAALAADRLK